MALVEARKEGRLGGYSMGDRNFCNAYRNFCRPKCAYQMVRSAATSLFLLLFARPKLFTFSSTKFTLLAECAIRTCALFHEHQVAHDVVRDEEPPARQA